MILPCYQLTKNKRTCVIQRGHGGPHNPTAPIKMTKAERRNKKCRVCGDRECDHPGGSFCKLCPVCQKGQRDHVGGAFCYVEAPQSPPAMFVMASDGDGHGYVIPEERQSEFYSIVEAIDRYWGRDAEDDGSHAPTIPDWAIEIGGARCLVSFPSFTLRGKVYL